MDCYIPTFSEGEFSDELARTHHQSCGCRRCTSGDGGQVATEMPTLEDLADIYLLLGTALMAVDYLASLHDELLALGLVERERL
jgi:hypothetical protein